MTRAAFLDRDGTVIELVHHLTNPADVRLIEGAGTAIARLNLAGWRVIIVTNQSVIGRGKLTKAGLVQVHNRMLDELAKYGATVDAIYFCPVVPMTNDPTIVEDEMRKPGPGMLLQAARENDADLARSWMVGDTVSDMLAGVNAGCQTALVRTGYGSQFLHDRECISYEADSLSGFVDHVLDSR